MTVLAQITVGNILIMIVDTDPSTNPTPAELGSIASFTDGGDASLYFKTGKGDTNWERVT